MSAVDAVLWDLGGVLCRFRPDQRTMALAHASGRSPQEVEHVIDVLLRRDLDLGGVTPAELLDHVRTALDWDCDYAALTRAWCAAFTPDQRVLAIARRVTVKSGLLTDNGPPLADNFSEQLPEVAAVVSARVFSSDIAATKPSRAAFDAACRALGAEPMRVVFVDDNPENVRGAREAGLHAVRYTTPERLHRHLAGSSATSPAAVVIP